MKTGEKNTTLVLFLPRKLPSILLAKTCMCLITKVICKQGEESGGAVGWRAVVPSQQ